jgi:hypothetical protein
MDTELNYNPRTATGEVIAEARKIFDNLKKHHSKALLLCLSSELRMWEWTESMDFNQLEERLRTCMMCGITPRNEDSVP